MKNINNEEIILNELNQIAVTNNIIILFASEVGSRAYGYNSDDSDYDVKFIYMKPEKEYLKIKRNNKDTMHFDISNQIKLDITGWEITKFLDLLYTGNYSTYEWLKSSIKYYVDKNFKRLLINYDKYFINFKMICAYHNYTHDIYKLSSCKSTTNKEFLIMLNNILIARELASNSLESYIKHLNIINKFYIIKDENIKNIILNLVKDRSYIMDSDSINTLNIYISEQLHYLKTIIDEWDGKKDSTEQRESIDNIFYSLIKIERNIPVISTDNINFNKTTRSYKINYDDGTYEIYIVVEKYDIPKSGNKYMIVNLSGLKLFHSSDYKSLETVERHFNKMIRNGWIRSYEPIKLKYGINEEENIDGI